MISSNCDNWNDLSPEEQARLKRSVPIEHDDTTAICTKAGWQNWEKYKNEHNE